MFFTLGGLPAPSSGKTSLEVARLDKNENPFSLPSGLMEEIRQLTASLEINRYPDPSYKRLKAKLSGLYGTSSDQLVIGNGGDEILWLLFAAYSITGKPVITLNPTFSEYYHLAKVYGVEHQKIDLNKEKLCFSFDQDDFLNKVKNGKYSLVLIDTPNNPTGMPVDTGFLMTILEIADCPVVIDEAYAEFGDGSFLDVLSSQALPENLVLLKTLSKAWGMAGLRLGFSISGKKITNKLSGIKSPFNVNVFTEAAACKILEYEEWMKTRVESIKKTRDCFIKKTNEIRGWRAFPSKANFVLVEHDFSEDLVNRHLSDRKIKVKNVRLNNQNDKRSLRVSIGTEKEMDRLLRLFNETGNNNLS